MLFTATMENDLKKIQERHDEIERLLQGPEVLKNPSDYQKLLKEYNNLSRTVRLNQELKTVSEAIENIKKSFDEETDLELKEIAREELIDLEKKREDLLHHIEDELNPPDPMADRDIIMEIRAGVGGDEAELFAANLFRMYARYAERKGWKTVLIDSHHTPLGGFKEVIFEIRGEHVYKHLRLESGVHRVQRVPETEKNGRVHTSTATVAVLPVAEEVDVVIKPEDIKIEVSTSGGAGGQSVNTTYSAIRIVHLPTGIVVSCQNERSQRQNKERAMEVLRSRIFAKMREETMEKERAARKSQIGFGMRAEKIRTYNFPQDRLTDHRVSMSWHNLPGILDGEIEEITQELFKKEKQENSSA